MSEIETLTDYEVRQLAALLRKLGKAGFGHLPAYARGEWSRSNVVALIDDLEYEPQ
jgi:hypothetical protein